MVDWYLSLGIKKYKKTPKTPQTNKQTNKRQWKKTTTKYSPY